MQTSVLLQRLSYGLLAITVALALVVADGVVAYSCEWGPPLGPLLRTGSVLPLACAALISLAVIELNNLLVGVGFRPMRWWTVLTCAAMMLTPWLSAGQIVTDYSFADDGVRWVLILLAGSLVGSAFLLVVRRRTEGAIGTIASTWLVILYLGLFPSFIMQMRCPSTAPGAFGAWVFMFFLAVTKASDIGAYFVGSFLGRHKLIPSVSPAKSVEGAIGGVAFSISVSLVLNTWVPTLIIDSDPARFLTVTQAVVFGVVVSVFAQMGDLFESLLKRDARIKDSGSVIPTFGGILDLVDSPALAAPAAWLLLTQWWDVL